MSNTTTSKLEWKPGYTCFFFAALTGGSEYRIFGCYGSDDYRACYFPRVVTRDLVQLATAKTIEEIKALCEQHFNRGSAS
jgi:hypothetical protein